MARRKRSRDEWSRLVAEWQASGQSRRAFAVRKGISPATFSWWCSRLGSAPAGRPAAELVPVRVVPEEPGAVDSFRILLPDGVGIEVPADFAAADLQRLLEVLGRRTC